MSDKNFKQTPAFGAASSARAGYSWLNVTVAVALRDVDPRNQQAPNASGS